VKRSGTIPSRLEKESNQTVTFNQADVNGIPTYELAEKGKHDLDLMLTCCEAEVKAFESNQGQFAPAPFYFNRAMILLKKEKRWEELIRVAECYFKMIEEYKSKAGKYSAKVWLGTGYEDMKKRLDFAYSRLEK